MRHTGTEHTSYGRGREITRRRERQAGVRDEDRRYILRGVKRSKNKAYKMKT